MTNNNLLIVGAGIYGLVASEIAADMRCFEKIDFVDDEKEVSINGEKVIGTTNELNKLATQYSKIVVAIGNPDIRLSLLKKIKEEVPCQIVSLISPKSYFAPSAKVMEGCIIEPMAVVQSNCVLSEGCIVSAGAVINHACLCSEGVHVDCNATIAAGSIIPARTKVEYGSIYDMNTY